MIRIWKSFSCNNSSSFRLVARFADAKTAKDVGTELSAFLTEHATQMDAIIEDSGEIPNAPTPAAQALGKKYGFPWKRYLIWGDEMMLGDEPKVGSEGDVLVVYHDYCGGGLGKDVDAYLKAAGAREVKEDKHGAPTVSVIFSLPPNSAKLQRAIKAMTASGEDEVELKTPWSQRRETYGDVAVFSDKKTMGFFAPVFPQELGLLREWLAKNGVKQPSIRVCEYDDLKKFRAIGQARCLACQAALEYLDPRTHGIDKEQLVCAACGGMYEVSAFMAEAPKKGMKKQKKKPPQKKTKK